jgi:hypothetical protein
MLDIIVLINYLSYLLNDTAMPRKFVFPFTALLCLLISCTSSHVNKSRINQSAFPPDFKNSKYILLIEKINRGINARGMNNYIRKSFQKHYSGKFEMADHNDILKDPKYQDKGIYRFILTDVVWSSTTTIMGPGQMDINQSYSLDFHLFDRLEVKNYPSLGVASGVPAKAINRTSVILNTKLNE